MRSGETSESTNLPSPSDGSFHSSFSVTPSLLRSRKSKARSGFSTFGWGGPVSVGSALSVGIGSPSSVAPVGVVAGVALGVVVVPQHRADQPQGGADQERRGAQDQQDPAPAAIGPVLP